MNKIRVLHCINGMGSGGAETDIINWNNILSQKNVYFDFLLRTKDIFYEEKIKNNGGKIYYTSHFPKSAFKNIIETNKFLKNNASKYSAIHVHGNSTFYIIPLILAKKYGIPIRIFHIHNTKSNNKISAIIHIINKEIMKLYANKLIACSKLSADFCNMKKPIIIKNMIDIERFRKHTVNVDDIKAKYKIPNSKNIFIHVGRFLKVKNQNFIIDIFNEILKQEADSILLLIGIGPLQNEIMKKVINLNIEKKVMFLGEIDDVHDILQISNLMIFPSLYEGVPLTLLEAQAAELKIVAADTIDKETRITPFLNFYEIDKSKYDWAQYCIEILNKKVSCDIDKCFKAANYDLESEAEVLERIYKGEV